jgi:hypothetical protein
MAKRTDTKIAILVQVMDELGFDQETITQVTGVPRRTVSDIANRKGYWAATGEVNELRETYRLHLRKCIRDEAVALGLAAVRRFEEIVKDSNFLTAFNIASAVMNLASNFDDRG